MPFWNCSKGEARSPMCFGGMVMNEAKNAALKEEVNFIHFANVLYWRQGAQSSREARAEYQRRQDRLREIRSEVLDLRFSDNN